MFGIDSGELLIIAVVALLVIGPKDLPRAMRAVGGFVGRARGMAKHFRTGFDAMLREAELEDMEKLWKSENDRIMREHPADKPAWDEAKGEADPAPAVPKPPPPASSRPKAPPARGKTLPSGMAPPIPAPAPAAPPAPGDDGA